MSGYRIQIWETIGPKFEASNFIVEIKKSFVLETKKIEFPLQC